ncbi:O-antigen ligase family protein [Rhodococcus sp. HNM0563]|uniref:O-antigen ligase family protein n=1 Tax=Rhodococcus sp. HNM0563 TaxID=2716339 RepID=UPI001469B9A0|nr:O-antigen ligase family protein [Rhodococcus sp. HNM0563]NLU61682.1 O-antigen ligase family protein [Rhodococcus sp. HNM0563]
MTVIPNPAHVQFSHQDPKGKLGGYLWVIVIAIVPIHRLIASTFGNNFEILVLAALVICVALGRVGRPAAAPIWIICAILIPLASLFSGASSDTTRSLAVGIQLGALVGMMPFVLRYYASRDETFIDRALIGFISIQTISSIVGIAQLSGASVFGLEANSGRANGLAAHPNVLGLMASLTILMCYYYTTKASGRKRVACVLIAVINAAALIGSGSLSTMTALAAGAIVMLVASRATIKTAIAVFAAVISIVIGTIALGYEPSDLLNPVESRVNTVLGVTNDGVASLSIRQATYDFALESIRHDPITGVGMDSTNQGTFNGTTVVHNYLLRAWYQGGILLILAMATITAALCRLIIISLREGRNALPAAMIAAILIFGMTSAFYNQQQYWVPLLFAVAIYGLIDTRTRSNRSHTASSESPTVESRAI